MFVYVRARAYMHTHKHTVFNDGDLPTTKFLTSKITEERIDSFPVHDYFTDLTTMFW
jgi:hypothetical protein